MIVLISTTRAPNNGCEFNEGPLLRAETASQTERRLSILHYTELARSRRAALMADSLLKPVYRLCGLR